MQCQNLRESHVYCIDSFLNSGYCRLSVCQGEHVAHIRQKVCWNNTGCIVRVWRITKRGNKLAEILPARRSCMLPLILSVESERLRWASLGACVKYLIPSKFAHPVPGGGRMLTAASLSDFAQCNTNDMARCIRSSQLETQ